MEKHDFPGLSTHELSRKMFRQKIAAFLEDHRTTTKPGIPVSNMLFRQGWFKNHVLKTDKQYSKFLNTRGVR